MIRGLSFIKSLTSRLIPGGYPLVTQCLFVLIRNPATANVNREGPEGADLNPGK